MKRIYLVVLLGCGLGAGSATAQSGDGRCAASASAVSSDCPPTADGPRSDMGPRSSGPQTPASGMARGRAQPSADDTPGWSMMSPAEQRVHRDRMQSFRSYGDCAAYRDRHRHEMAVRAAQRHSATPIGARRDACEELPR